MAAQVFGVVVSSAAFARCLYANSKMPFTIAVRIAEGSHPVSAIPTMPAGSGKCRQTVLSPVRRKNASGSNKHVKTDQANIPAQVTQNAWRYLRRLAAHKNKGKKTSATIRNHDAPLPTAAMCSIRNAFIVFSTSETPDSRESARRLVWRRLRIRATHLFWMAAAARVTTALARLVCARRNERTKSRHPAPFVLSRAVLE